METSTPPSTSTITSLRTLASVVHALTLSRAWAFRHALFATKPREPHGPPRDAHVLRERLTSLDRVAVVETLGVERGVLEGALGRMSRALGRVEDEEVVGEGERVERGVREL